jgi:hypothetical protein
MRSKKVYPSSFISGFFDILILFYIADFIIQDYQLVKEKMKVIIDLNFYSLYLNNIDCPEIVK